MPLTDDLLAVLFAFHLLDIFESEQGFEIHRSAGVLLPEKIKDGRKNRKIIIINNSEKQKQGLRIC